MTDEESSKQNQNTSASTELIVALDVDTWDEAKCVINDLGNQVSFYKIGYQLFFREGMACVDKLLAENKKVFLDLKLGDIPRTMAAAVTAIPKGVDIVSVQGSTNSIEAAAKTRPDLNFYYVQGLSSEGLWDDDEPEVIQSWYNALDSGAAGFIVSGDAVRLAVSMRSTVKALKNVKLLAPGVRLESQETNDHLTTISPEQAKKSNIDFIVVGRPILNATNRPEEVKNFL